jgi:hypothetical protein
MDLFDGVDCILLAVYLEVANIQEALDSSDRCYLHV